MESNLPLRKGCNCYRTAHCYLVEPKDFDLRTNFLVGNHPGGALNFVAVDPKTPKSLVAKITGGRLRIAIFTGEVYEFEGSPNETNGLDFSIDPVIPLTEANKGFWHFSWEVAYETISDLKCENCNYGIENEIGQEIPEETIE